jgi:hypothetical protein
MRALFVGGPLHGVAREVLDNCQTYFQPVRCENGCISRSWYERFQVAVDGAVIPESYIFIWCGLSESEARRMAWDAAIRAATHTEPAVDTAAIAFALDLLSHYGSGAAHLAEEAEREVSRLNEQVRRLGAV